MQLNNLVKKYNTEICKVGDANLRQLSANDIQENGLENYEIWDIKRLLSNSDWAVYQYVMDGILWCFIQQLVVEERRMLQLHAQPLINWLKHQGNVLLNLLHCEMRMNSYHRKELLLHSFQIMCSLFAIKHDSLNPLDQQSSLEGTPLL
jgi:hypothetical protein